MTVAVLRQLWVAVAVVSTSLSAVNVPSGAIVALAVTVALLFVQAALSNCCVNVSKFTLAGVNWINPSLPTNVPDVVRVKSRSWSKVLLTKGIG